MNKTLCLILACLTLTAALPSAALAQDNTPMPTPKVEHEDLKSPWLAFGLNFFLPGAGYLYNGQKPLYVSLPMVAGAVGLTYVEQIHTFGDSKDNLLKTDKTAFAVMFGAVFVINTALAIDAYQEAAEINERGHRSAGLDFGFSVVPDPDGEGLSYGATLGGEF